MTGTDPVAAGRSSNAVARRRDALLRWLLLRHPATAGMLVQVGLFPSRKKASRRLQKLRQRGEVRLLGIVALKDGRPEHVYARGRWKADNLLHEVQLTRVCLKIDADAIRRGAGETDARLRPDAELLIGGQRYLLELDCGTIAYEVIVTRRFLPYRSSPDLVLWVCPTESRMEGLRRRAEAIRDVALFTTLDQALRNPHAPIWVDYDGERAALPRGGQRRGRAGDKGEANAGDKGGDKEGALSPYTRRQLLET